MPETASAAVCKRLIRVEFCMRNRVSLYQCWIWCPQPEVRIDSAATMEGWENRPSLWSGSAVMSASSQERFEIIPTGDVNVRTEYPPRFHVKVFQGECWFSSISWSTTFPVEIHAFPPYGCMFFSVDFVPKHSWGGEMFASTLAAFFLSNFPHFSFYVWIPIIIYYASFHFLKKENLTSSSCCLGFCFVFLDSMKRTYPECAVLDTRWLKVMGIVLCAGWKKNSCVCWVGFSYSNFRQWENTSIPSEAQGVDFIVSATASVTLVTLILNKV